LRRDFTTRVLIINLIQVDSKSRVFLSLFLDQFKIIVAEGALGACRCLASVIISEWVIIVSDRVSFFLAAIYKRRYIQWRHAIIAKHGLNGDLVAASIRDSHLMNAPWLSLVRQVAFLERKLAHTLIKVGIVVIRSMRLIW